jgi:hypothetical protein
LEIFNPQKITDATIVKPADVLRQQTRARATPVKTIPAAYTAFNGSKPRRIRAADPHFRDCRVESKRGIIRWMQILGLSLSRGFQRANHLHCQCTSCRKSPLHCTCEWTRLGDSRLRRVRARDRPRMKVHIARNVEVLGEWTQSERYPLHRLSGDDNS